MKIRSRQLLFLLPVWALLFSSACRQGMYDEPKFLPLQENGMYPDRQASRPLPPGTVAQGSGAESAGFLTGRNRSVLVDKVPLPITRALLERGHERFNIFCAPCHDQLGYGNGMIAMRGFRNPPSYHLPRLVNAPDGYLFEVATQGYGTMYAYADRVAPEDRWAIVAYIRALELSQHATAADAPPAERAKLEQMKP